MFRKFVIALSLCLATSSLMAAPSKPVIHVFAASEAAAGSADCTPWEGKCLIFANKGKPVVVSDYTYSVPKDGPPAILLNLSQTDASAINTLIQKHHAGRLAIVVNGAVAAAPKIKVDSIGTGVQLSFSDAKERHDVELKLQGK